MPVSLAKTQEAEAAAPVASPNCDNEPTQNSSAQPDSLYTAAKVDAKLHKQDATLRNDIISTFKEFEKVLRRTRQDLAQERFARKAFEETSTMRINQLQAMVDEVAPRMSPHRRGANHERRSERDERQRRRWEEMMWYD